MKLYEVRIDNDPGGWKSGEDKRILIPADNEEDAIKRVKSGEWGEDYDFDKGEKYYTDKESNPGERFFTTYISRGANVSAIEIKFPGYKLDLKPDRVDKIDKILKDENN